VKRITLDEALYLEAKHVGAVYPTMLTRPGAQVRIASSAGLLESEQLRRIRDRGRAGKDKRLAYVEYGAKRRPCLRADCLHQPGSDGCALDDRELWWAANCALWQGRINETSLEDQRNSMPPQEFMREFLSWWEDPESLGGAIPYGPWLNLADASAERGDDPVFGLDVDQDRRAWIAVCWSRDDGCQVMLTNDGNPLQARQAVDECERLTKEWDAPVFASPLMFEELELAGVRSFKATSLDFTASCGSLEDAVKGGTIHHGNQPLLNNAVKAAKWRAAGADGSRAFQLKDSPEVGPLAAVTRALHGWNKLKGNDYDPLEHIF
jgi:hypothetical protein